MFISRRIVGARATWQLVPEIDEVGVYSEVSHLPVFSDDPLALSALAPQVSRRISGRTGEQLALHFELDLDDPTWNSTPAWLLLRVYAVSAGGAGLRLTIGDSEYLVNWTNTGTWITNQKLLVPFDASSDELLVEGSSGVVVLDSYEFYSSESELPDEAGLYELQEGELVEFDPNAPSREPLSEAELAAIRVEAGSLDYNRRPYSLSPHSKGMLLEDIWPSLWLTVAEAESVGPRIEGILSSASWAEDYWDLLLTEAESVVSTSPQVPMERAGWRHDYYSPDTAGHLLYDSNSPDDHLDPLTGEFYQSTATRQAWVLLTHERTFKIMRSLGVLYAVTEDERYATWVAAGMRLACDYVELAEQSGWERSSFGGTAVWYQPLYDSTMLLALANSYSLTRTSAAYSQADHDRIRSAIFESRIPQQMAFLENIPGLQNMAAYAAAAVAVAGELYEREDWLNFGVGEEYGFVRWLEANVPDGADGKPDGLWKEQTTFYHFYALAPMITLYNLAEGLSPENVVRFRAMFEAPLQLVQPDLSFHLMGDLGAPGEFSLVDVRSFYEFAAGNISYDTFAPVLARIYTQADLKRGCLWSLLYGPDSLPVSTVRALPVGQTQLPVSGYGSFRDFTSDFSLGFRGGQYRGGHDHPDRLSIFLHQGSIPVAADLGEPGYGLRTQTGDYFRRTIAHNTLFANESDNSGSAEVDWRFDARPPRARGVISSHGGVRFERTVYFDPPFVIVSDSYASSESKRFGWVFNAMGELSFLNLQSDVDTVATPPFGMPSLPTAGLGYEMLTERSAALVSDTLTARWSISEDLFLDALISSDGEFEATRARSAGNPFPRDRGVLVLRAPGESRRFYTVLELNEGESRVSGFVQHSGDFIEIQLKDGSRRSYEWSTDSSESYSDWAARVFGDGSISSDSLAPGSNLTMQMCYALGLGPDELPGELLPQMTVEAGEGGARRCVVKSDLNRNALGAFPTLETSDDLKIWQPWLDTKVLKHDVDLTQGRDLYLIQDTRPLSSSVNRFYRISVSDE